MVDHWDLGGDPLAVALVIETSSHIQMMAAVIRGMGNIFTETVMALDGEAAVIAYDRTVDVTGLREGIASDPACDAQTPFLGGRHCATASNSEVRFRFG
jgi:hypothetical protein